MKCGSKCDFLSYYKTQAGRGYSSLPVYRGFYNQRGFGIWGALANRFGVIVPALKYIGEQVLRNAPKLLGINEGGENFGTSLRNTIESVGKNIASEAVKQGIAQLQTGKGKKRKRKIKKTLKRNKLQNYNIFDVK